MSHSRKPNIWQKMHIDLPLLLGILGLMGFGLFVIYSASGEDLAMMERQLFRMGLSLGLMLILAQINPEVFRRWALPICCWGYISSVRSTRAPNAGSTWALWSFSRLN
jgi:rod shape determining protein RodA